ncbi:MAG: Arc family DNA-binding protein [Cyanobacteria bacterium P01_D01_bin.123]
MANLTLKNIPDALYEHLKETAHLNHRSLNSETIACLEKVLMPQRLTADEKLSIARSLRNQVKVETIDADEITDAKNSGRL